MAIRIGCCMNLPPPTKSPFHSNTSQLPISISGKRKAEEDDQATRNFPRAIGVASLVIGLEMMSSINNVAIGAGVPKWSDTRMCPQWRVNSLESIVPENLPRPTFRRRWENVDYNATATADAPPVKFLVERLTHDCFSM